MSSKVGVAAKRNDAGAIFLAGSCSGILTSSVLQPLDVIKTHLIADHYARGKSTSPSPLTSTFASVVRNILRKEGVLGLWRGTGPTVVRVGLGAGLYFLMLDRVMAGMRKIHEAKVQLVEESSATETAHTGRDVLPDRSHRSSDHLVQSEVSSSIQTDVSTSGQTDLPQEAARAGRPSEGLPALYTLTAGAVTRSTAAALLSPITVVKTRMEYSAVTGHVYRNTFHAVTSIFRKEGVRGLVSGLGPTLLRDAPYSGLYLLMYDKTRKGLRDVLPATTPQVYINFVSGGLAGGGATVATHPPDVIRTRVQLASGGATRGALSTAQLILQTEGASALFAGITPRIAKRALQMALTWSIYEELTRIFVKRSIWGNKSPDN